MVVVPILTVLSNMAFIIPAVYTLSVGLLHESMTFFMITIFSSMYHVCFNMKNSDSCGLDPGFLQYMDFYFSYLCFVDVIVYFLDIRPRRYKAILHHILSTILLMTTYFIRFNTVVHIVLFSIVIAIAIAYQARQWIMYILKQRQVSCMVCTRLIKFEVFETDFHYSDLLTMSIGMMFFISGFVMQIFSYSEYDILHSLWHIMLATASIFFFRLYRKPTICGMLYRKVIPTTLPITLADAPVGV